jgi:hypothetical protein
MRNGHEDRGIGQDSLPKALPLPAALPATSSTETFEDQIVTPSGRRRGTWTQNALPLASSLALHAGVVVLGLLTAKAIQVVSTPPPVVENQAFAPTMDLQETTPEGLTHPSLVFDDPTREFRQDQAADVQVTGFAKSAGPSEIPQLDSGGERGDTANVNTWIGIGDGRKRAGVGPGTGPGGAAPRSVWPAAGAVQCGRKCLTEVLPAPSRSSATPPAR